MADHKRSLMQRLHAAMGEVDYIQKEWKHGMNYSIVSHDAVTARVRPVLHKHGVIYPVSVTAHAQDGNRTSADVEVTFINVDDPADRLVVKSFGYGIDAQDKGCGKAVSYAVKYALLKTLGLETGDDPDDHQDVKHVPAAPVAEPTFVPADDEAVKTVMDAFRERGFASDRAIGLVKAACKKHEVDRLTPELAAQIVSTVTAGKWDHLKGKPSKQTAESVTKADIDAAFAGAQ